MMTRYKELKAAKDNIDVPYFEGVVTELF